MQDFKQQSSQSVVSRHFEV